MIIEVYLLINQIIETLPQKVISKIISLIITRTDVRVLISNASTVKIVMTGCRIELIQVLQMGLILVSKEIILMLIANKEATLYRTVL